VFKFDLYLIARLGAKQAVDFVERIEADPEVARLREIEIHYSRCVRSAMADNDAEEVGRLLDEMRPHRTRATRAFRRAVAARLPAEPAFA
jgi:hypothetical protein